MEYIRVDKATLTKCVKKLIEIGYVKSVPDERDRRIRHLYPTEKAIPAARRIKEIHEEFYRTLCVGIPLQEIQTSERVLEQMMENVNQKVWHRMEEP